MAQTSQLGSPFAILGASFVLGARTVSAMDVMASSAITVSQQATHTYPPSPFELLIQRMQLQSLANLEMGYLHLILQVTPYEPKRWTFPKPAREVLHRLSAYPGIAYDRIAYILNEEIEKENR